MYNTVLETLESFWKLVSKSYISWTERFSTKKCTQCLQAHVYFLASQIEWQKKHCTIVSDLLPLTLVLIKER